MIINGPHCTGIGFIRPESSNRDSGRAGFRDRHEAGNERVNAISLVGHGKLRGAAGGRYLDIDDERVVRPHRGRCGQDVSINETWAE
jgi:hypothetical protein